jgi:hypothetical protein
VIAAVAIQQCGGRAAFEEALRTGDLIEGKKDNRTYYFVPTVKLSERQSIETKSGTKGRKAIDRETASQIEAGMEEISWSTSEQPQVPHSSAVIRLTQTSALCARHLLQHDSSDAHQQYSVRIVRLSFVQVPALEDASSSSQKAPMEGVPLIDSFGAACLDMGKLSKIATSLLDKVPERCSTKVL